MSNDYKSLVSSLVARSLESPGAGKDLARCINAANPIYGFAESTVNNKYVADVDFENLFRLPQKQVFRAIQFINTLVSGSIEKFDRTYFRTLIALHAAGKYNLTTDAVHALASNTRNAACNTRGISLGTINAAGVRAHGLSTVTTKVSGSTGKNGVYQVLGVTFADSSTNHEIVLNSDSIMVHRFFEIVSKATTKQLETMGA